MKAGREAAHVVDAESLEKELNRVRAAAGRNTGPKQGLVPAVVTVPRGRFARRDFIYDSGIR